MIFRVVATNTGVSALFYAALDVCDLLCWTDDERLAIRFDSEDEAARFAAICAPGQDWAVRQAPR